MLSVALLALAFTAQASPDVSATARDGYGGGVCVDVTVDGVTTPDILCPMRSDTQVRSFAAKGRTIYFGAPTLRTGRVDLVGRRRTVRARVSGTVYATAGPAKLGAIVARTASGRARAARDIDPFLLPGPQARLPRLRDESDRRVQPIVAAPRILVDTPNRRAKALCLGLKIAGATIVGRSFCVTERQRFDVRFTAECKERRQIVYGLGPASIASARGIPGGALKVRRAPRKLKHKGSIILGTFSGTLPRRIAGYSASGTELASATLAGGCSSNTRSKIR